MKFKYEVGMRICLIERKDRGGVVTREDEDGLWFQWDKEVGTNEEHWLEDYEHEIMPDTPEAREQWAEMTKKIQAKIDEAASLLEQAFKAWRQANAMQWYGEEDTGDDGFEGAYALRMNNDLDLSKFEKVVEENGWSTSSLYC